LNWFIHGFVLGAMIGGGFAFVVALFIAGVRDIFGDAWSPYGRPVLTVAAAIGGIFGAASLVWASRTVEHS
jgi:hypothetical protein